MSINDYWASTIDEINIILDDYNNKTKEMLRARYETCKLNARFVGMVIGGKDIPDITEIYEGVFDNDVDDEAAIKYQEKQFAMLAAAVNSSRKGKK